MSSRPEFQDATPVPVDRSDRRPVTMRGYAILPDGTHHEISLLDLSYEGCGIDTTVALEPGQKLKLSVLRLGGIEAEVRWCRGNKAGLIFIPAPEAKQHWPRRSERVSLAAEVSLRRIGKSTFRVTATDASPDGCKVQLVERPAIDEHVLVKFEGLEPLEAKVCWIDGHTAGVKFVRPMHPAVFELLIERLTAA
jgi:hypothetical protein